MATPNYGRGIVALVEFQNRFDAVTERIEAAMPVLQREGQALVELQQALIQSENSDERALGAALDKFVHELRTWTEGTRGLVVWKSRIKDHIRSAVGDLEALQNRPRPQPGQVGWPHPARPDYRFFGRIPLEAVERLRGNFALRGISRAYFEGGPTSFDVFVHMDDYQAAAVIRDTAARGAYR